VLGEHELVADQIVLQDMQGDAPRETLALDDTVRVLKARLGMDTACTA